MDVEKHIRQYLEGLFQEAEYAENFLVEIKADDSKYEVFIDGDTGVTIERCQQISRYLENKLEENGVVGEKYTLEISSPGATRPLTMERQYGKHVGRVLKILKTDGSSLKGALGSVNGDSIEITTKTKKEGAETHVIPFADIKESVVQISFK